MGGSCAARHTSVQRPGSSSVGESSGRTRRLCARRRFPRSTRSRSASLRAGAAGLRPPSRCPWPGTRARRVSRLTTQAPLSLGEAAFAAEAHESVLGLEPARAGEADHTIEQAGNKSRPVTKRSGNPGLLRLRWLPQQAAGAAASAATQQPHAGVGAALVRSAGDTSRPSGVHVTRYRASPYRPAGSSVPTAAPRSTAGSRTRGPWYGPPNPAVPPRCRGRRRRSHGGDAIDILRQAVVDMPTAALAIAAFRRAVPLPKASSSSSTSFWASVRSLPCPSRAAYREDWLHREDPDWLYQNVATRITLGGIVMIVGSVLMIVWR
jgi:hypothetical protein